MLDTVLPRIILALLALALVGGLLFPFGIEWSHGRDFVVQLLATTLGVITAFALDRWWERNQERLQYAQQLAACAYQLAHLHAVSGRIIADITATSIPVVPFAAPALASLLVSPRFHQLAPHGVITVLTTLQSFIDAQANAIDDFRRRPDSGVVDRLKRRITALREILSLGQALVDEEQQRLGYAPVRTPADATILDRLTEALQRARRIDPR